MNVVELPTKEAGPQKQLYVFELYTDNTNSTFETRKHYGFMSYGDFVAIVDGPSKPVAMYPYSRIRSITTEPTAENDTLN